MGLPGVRVPKSFYPRIQSALETCSASVEVHPVSEQDRQRGLLAAFVCTSVEGDVVQVCVHTAQSIAPDQVAAVLEPLKSGRFRYFRSNPFLGEIEASLIAHGALPIGQESSDTTGKAHNE